MWFWMLPVLLLTTALGAQGLNADVIWFDELTSIGHAGGLTGPFTPIDVMQSIADHSPKHAPLFFELINGWHVFVGWHHAVLRALSLYFGVMTIAWVYRIGKDFVNWRTGFWAALLLGVNVFWVEYYHEIRMYTLQIFLTTMMIWHYLYLSDSQRIPRRFHWLGLIASATLSLYTQPFSFFVHVAIGIYHLLFVAKNRRWLQVVGAFLVTGLLYLLWLPITYIGVTTKFDTGTDAMPLGQAVETFIHLFSNNIWLVLLIPLAIAVGTLRHKSIRQSMKPIWLLAILILGLLLLVNEAVGLIPLRRARYFFVSWGMWSLVIGCGLAYLRWQWVSAIIVIAFMSSGFMLRDSETYLDYQGTVFAVNFYPPLHEYVAALDGKTKPHDYVLGFTEANFVNNRGKHGKSTADYYLETLLGIDGAFIPFNLNDENLKVDVPKKIDNHPYLLLTVNPLENPKVFDDTLMMIEADYTACDVVIDQLDLFVQRYVRQPLTCEHEYQSIVYDNGATIVDMFAEYDPLSKLIRITTGWTVADEQLLYEYNVSLQLVTGDWQNVGQTDRHLHDDLLKWYVAELPTDALPPDDYRIMVVVYNQTTGEKVTGTNLTTGETGTILPITVFTIEE